jgi:diguanylate cyclase
MMIDQARRLLRHFALAGNDDADPVLPDGPGLPARVAPAPALTPVDRANERLMGEIAEFLISTRLGITSHNLLIAHSAFSGEDPQLGRAIGQRRRSGEPVTQEWLDEQVSHVDQERAIRQLIGQLEESLGRFATTARTARSSTADCSAALEQQVDRVAHLPHSAGLDDVLGLAHAILDHTRKLETDFRSCELESRTLRERLARAQRDAEIDHLTGLPNRRAFEAVFDRTWREARAALEKLSVAICDIDRFKLVNDNHGHDTGDRVIKAVADALDRLSNQHCHVARHGGEEFVLLFRGLNKAQAREKLDAVRENFAQRRFVNRKTDDPIGMVTFSAGVADVFAYDTPREALRAADEALFLAKEQGRNAVMAAP